MSGGRGARVSGITPKLQKTIQDIREIAGQHSDEDIYSMLKECSMDPNETAQKLLHLDTFHEVKKKNVRRKEGVESRQSGDLGRPHDGHERGARGVGGNFNSQNTSQNTNGRKSLAVSKEIGISNTSRVTKTENKTASQVSRSNRVKSSGSKKVSNGKSSLSGAPLSHVEGDGSTANALSSDATRMPSYIKTQLSSSPAIISTKPKNISTNGDDSSYEDPNVKSSASVLEVGHINILVPPDYPIHGQKYWITNGKATGSNEKVQNGNSTLNMNTTTDDPKFQLADSNLSDQLAQSECSEKVVSKETNSGLGGQVISDNDASDLSDATLKLNISGGRQVVFPDHLQVPEAYKKKLIFGSFDSSWALEETPINGCNGMKVNTQVDNLSPTSEATGTISSTESGSVASTVHDPQEKEDPDHFQSGQPVMENTLPLADQVSSDVIVNTEEKETVSSFPNGGTELVNGSENFGFGYAPHAQLQAHDNSELRGGNVTASSSPDLNQNGLNQPADVTQDISSPLPSSLLRQNFHPNFFPYGYYPQFFVPQVPQYLTHGGFPQQPPVANVYLTSAAAAAAIKYPHPQQKQGSNTGTEGYNGVPSGFSTYGPYAFPYGIAPVVTAGNVTGEDDHSAQSKENETTQATEEQIDNSGGWMAGTGRTVSALQVNPFYGLAPGQGHPIVFPPVQTAFGPYPGFYHPAQAVPAPTHPHIQQPQSTIGSGEPVAPMPSALYQQQPHGVHVNWNNNKQ